MQTTKKKRLRAAVEQERLQLRTSAHDKLLDVVPPERFDALVAAHGGTYRTRLFPPAVTLGLFVEQVINVGVFHAKPVSDSRPSRSPIPAQAGRGVGG